MTFRGTFDILNNFHLVKVGVDGICFLNAESVFQTQKFLDSAEKATSAELQVVKAKRRRRQMQLRPDRNAVRGSVMEEVSVCPI